MKKTERVLSLLLAIILLLTGVPVGGFGMVSEARRQDAYSDAQSRLFVAESAKALPSLTKRLLPAEPPKEGTEDPALSGSESQTIVTGSDITSTSSVSGEQNGEALPSSAKTEQAAATTGQESPAQNQEEKDAQTLEAVRREMEKNPLAGGKALPIQDVDLNGTKSLARVNYIVNRDTDGIPSSISWVLTYFAPKEKTVHQAFVVANGDNLDQPVIGNRTYAPGEEAAMKAREAARNRQTDKAPLFLYDIETKEANKDGFFLTTITTPIHRDEAMVAKINAAKAAKSIDKKALKDVAKELEGRVYTLDMISVFGEQKITKRIQVNGKADLTATDENTTPVTHVFPQKQQQENPQQEQEKRVLFVAPNQDKKETAYQAPTFNATDTKQKEQAQILVYDFVLSQDGFYDFKAVDQRSLAQYEKQLTKVEEKGLTGEALQDARKAATLMVKPGQLVLTAYSHIEPIPEKTEQASASSEEQSAPVSSDTQETSAISSTPESKTTPESASSENAEAAPEKENTAAEKAQNVRDAAEKTLGLLSPAAKLQANPDFTATLAQGSLSHSARPMAAPLNPFVANRPIIVEVVDSENKGIKIPGAVVRIVGPNMVKEVTTGDDGKAILENCSAGDYKVIQVSAPDGYLANQTKIEFHFSAIETVKYVRIDDAKNLGTKLYFIEGTVADLQSFLGQPGTPNPDHATEAQIQKATKIANVELTLEMYDTENDKLGKFLGTRTAYSDANGHYTFNDLNPSYLYKVVLAWAPYEYTIHLKPNKPNPYTSEVIRFRENSQPIQEGNGTKYKAIQNWFLSKNENQKFTITVYNHELGDSTVRLPGSTFQVLNSKGEAIKSIGVLTTDADGQITFDLRPGEYILEQLTTDNNHRILKAQTRFVVQDSPSNTSRNHLWIPNPLKNISLVTYTREAVIDWNGITPDPQFQLVVKQNGQEMSNHWVQNGPIYRFENLHKYDDNHDQYAYQIILKETDEYYATYQIINGVTQIIVQKKTEAVGPGGTVTVTGNKLWYNDSEDLKNRPKSVQVVLLQNGQETAYKATVSAQTNWKYSFTNLPERDGNGNKYTYTVKEIDLVTGEGLPGYRTDTTRLGKNILNTRIDYSELGGSFTLRKIEKKNKNGQNEKGLEGAQFTLSGRLQNGQPAPDRTLKTDAAGNLTFNDIPAGIYTLRETSAPDRYQPSTETWQVEVADDGTTILTGSGVTNNGLSTVLADDINKKDDQYVKDGPGSQPRTEENRKAKNPKEFNKTLYTRQNLTEEEKKKEENQVGDISKRILNTVDKNRNEYQVELTVTGRGRNVFGSGEETDIVVVADHSGSIKGVNQDQVNQQVRNIFNAFTGFTNVNMGYVEYSGVAVDDSKDAVEQGRFPKRVDMYSGNVRDYFWNANLYEKNVTFSNGDPAVRKSVELSKPQDLLKPGVITNIFGGSTFTQRALLRAQEILKRGDPGAKKHIILITDGGPTVSFKAIDAQAENANWTGIYNPTAKRLPKGSNAPDSGVRYKNRATDFDYTTLCGDGLFYQFSDGKDYGSLDYSSYQVNGEAIFDSVFATVSTVRNLTEAGTEITTIGYNLKPNKDDGLFHGQEQYFFSQLASSAQNYSGVGSVGDKENAATDIFNEVSKQYYLNQQKKAEPTINKATVTDPMGKDVNLYLGEDGVFNEKDYVLVASDGSVYENGKAPAKGLLSGTTLQYDAGTQTLTIEGLTLGQDESVSLYYSVRLNDNAKDGNFKVTNQPTTLVNQGTTYQFPIPAIRDNVQKPSITVENEPYSATGRFRILKTNDKGEPLEGAYFFLRDKNHKTITIQPSDKNGLIEVNNLDPKYSPYILQEEEAPAGYVVSSYRWRITVHTNGITEIERIDENGQRSAVSASHTGLMTMSDVLSFAPMMSFAPVGRSYTPAVENHRIDSSVVFDDANKNDKRFHVTHQVDGQSAKDRLDLYFLMVPENQGDVDFFNSRISAYSRELRKQGKRGRINVIYGGHDPYSSREASWEISADPTPIKRDVRMGNKTDGAFMDRALAYTNTLLANRRQENTVKMVTFLSKNRDFTPEETYADHLEYMANMGVVSQYINITRTAGRKDDLNKYLYDTKNPMSEEAKQEIRNRLQSWSDGLASVDNFTGQVSRVFSAEQSDQVIANQALRIPLSENIHYVPATAKATIEDAKGNKHNVSVTDATVGGVTVLTTQPLTLKTGERLTVRYDVTLKGQYELAVSYPVYPAQSVTWEGSNNGSKKADIRPLYISDPGQTLQIEVKGLDGYSDAVNVYLTTGRAKEQQDFKLKNGESKSVTIFTFDQDGKTQGQTGITVKGGKPDNKNYSYERTDWSRYPRIQVLYKRKALNLTVRKVFNNHPPQDGEKVYVTLEATVDGKTITDWSDLGYSGTATKELTKLSEGVYQTVYKGLPLSYAGTDAALKGKSIKYTVKNETDKPKDVEVQVKKEQTVINYQPDEDLIRVEETEIPVLTVKNTTNELKFKKLGASSVKRDKNGNIKTDVNGNPIISLTPLPGVAFELRRETRAGSLPVKGYEHFESGPGGAFSFKNLPPGDYSIYETKPVLGYELPVQAVATFTIGADGKTVPGSVLSFKERTKESGNWILGVQRLLKNHVDVETAITQVEATDHNLGNRKMLYTQRIYLNRNGEDMTEANLSVFSAAADNPIRHATYTIYKASDRTKIPESLNFMDSWDAKDAQGHRKYALEEVATVGTPQNPADLSRIKLPNPPGTDFYMIEIKGELAVHDDKFTTKLHAFVSAQENTDPTHKHEDGLDRTAYSDDTIIFTGYRKGAKGEKADIMVPAEKDGNAYVVKNYRGSTFFSVQKKDEDDKTALAGAKFKLWAALGRNFEIVENEQTTKVNTLAEAITDKKGIVTFDNLPVNYNFYLEETQTAPGYALPEYQWIVQIRPVSFLIELHKKSRKWQYYLTQGVTEEAAKAEAAGIAYNQMLYPYTLPDATNRPAEDITADQEGFKVFVYQTDGRRPLIDRPMNKKGEPLNPEPNDSTGYQYDADGDVYAKQSYGEHPTIPGMWYRKGWVDYAKGEKDSDGNTGQMVPIKENGEPIKERYLHPATKWQGEALDGVSGATIRPLIVRDWIKAALKFDTSLANYDKDVAAFAPHIQHSATISESGQTLKNVFGITNKKAKFFVNKVDEEGNPLERATFMLYKQDENNKWKTPGIKPSVVKNQSIFKDLQDGTYLLQEKKSPEGYEKATKEWIIKVLAGKVISKDERQSITPMADDGNFRSASALSSERSLRSPLDVSAIPRLTMVTPAGKPAFAANEAVQPGTLSTVFSALAKTFVAPAAFVPMRAAGDHFAEDNAKNDQPIKNPALQAVFRKPKDNNNNSVDVELGVWITSISDVNKDTGEGTFTAKIFLDPDGTTLATQQQAGSEKKAKRYLQFGPNSNLTINSITEYSLSEKKYSDIGFGTEVGNITGQTGDAQKWPRQLDQNRIELNKTTPFSRYVVLVSGTYSNKVSGPLALKVSYDGLVKRPDIYETNYLGSKVVKEQGLVVKSEATATSQVYHYDRYQVTFDANGGSPQSAPQTVRYNRALSKPQDPTKDGYRFTGWTENGAKVNDNDWTTKDAYKHVKADHAFVAGWEETTVPEQYHTVEFYDQQDYRIDKFTTKVKHGEPYVKDGRTLRPWPEGTYEGYEPDGWDIERYNSSTGRYYYEKYEGTEPITEDIYLYARPWVRKDDSKRTVRFAMYDEQTGKEIPDKSKTITVTKGTKVPDSDIPKALTESPDPQDAYIFSEWGEWDGTKIRPFDFKTQPIDHDITLYGMWQLKTYTVTFKDGENAWQYHDIKHGTRLSAPTTPSKPGYRFAGWKQGAVAFDPQNPVTADATYTATWEKIEENQVVVHFDKQDGSPVIDVPVTKGQSVSAPQPNPTREGFTFDGWYFDGNRYDFNQTVDKEITLTALWKKDLPEDQKNELTVVNKKQDFKGEFTLKKFHRQDKKDAQGNLKVERTDLSKAFFTLTKHPQAEKPETFDPQQYVVKYNKHSMWDSGIKAFYTDDKGNLRFDNLEPGVYDLQEVKPPQGYLKNPTTYVVVVNEIGNTILVPSESYDPAKYPIEVDHGTDPGVDPNKPEERTEPMSLDGKIEVVDYSLTPSVENGVIRPLQDQKLQMQYTLKLPSDVIEGDWFSIKIDDNLDFHGLTLTPMPPESITTENGEIVAKSKEKIIDEHGVSKRLITYKFTDYVTNRTNIVIKQKMPLFVDPNVVTETSTPIKPVNVIAGKENPSDTIVVYYESYYGSTWIYGQSGITIKGNTQIATNNLGGRFYDNESITDPRKGTITAYYYAFGTNCALSSKYRLTLEATGPQGARSDVKFKDDSSKVDSRVDVEVYTVDAFRRDGYLNTNDMPPSYGPLKMKLTDKKTVTPTIDSAGRLSVELENRVNNRDLYRYGYIVKVTAPYEAPSNANDVSLYTQGALWTDTTFSGYYGPYTRRNGVYYWNYLHRYVASNEISSEKRINLTLTKRGMTGKNGDEKPEGAPTLPGAGFKLTNNEGFEDYVVTDNNGTLTFTNLKPGSYSLEEVLTPKGYTPFSKVWDLIVNADGTVKVENADSRIDVKDEGKSLTVWNSKTPIDKPRLDFPNVPNQITFTKVGEQDVHLSGATFELRRAPSLGEEFKKENVKEEDQQRVSDAHGTFGYSELQPGYYQVWEIQAPTGYAKPAAAVATFTVDANTGKIIDLQINGRDPVGENLVRNLRPMKIELLKVDGERRPIGVDKVKFLLKAAVQKTPPDAADSLSIEKDLTNSDPCLVEIPDSWDGEYILTEEVAPAGYIKTTNRYHIRVDRTNRIVQLTKVTNEQGIEIPYLDQGLLSKKPIDLYNDKMVGQVKLQVENIQPRYPSTGGFGPSQWFTLIGCAVMIGSAVWFIASDRKTRRRTLRKGGDAQ